MIPDRQAQFIHADVVARRYVVAPASKPLRSYPFVFSPALRLFSTFLGSGVVQKVRRTLGQMCAFGTSADDYVALACGSPFFEQADSVSAFTGS